MKLPALKLAIKDVEEVLFEGSDPNGGDQHSDGFELVRIVKTDGGQIVITGCPHCGVLTAYE